ncbi:glycosyltransferase family 39 protein [Xenophilus arseniciresistens]|uniref:Glycosyltransferase family 39 protein n=1 Tax=Xenophilus arseniciresistens TaxID=1283306 RepID=A0AAE3NBM1_9BURK|nr:glycosyltransferase family 39 protein [Xenophilus arseniciresistens]MDA7418373.1 glycosyltransferase family 39 protein [Xenophilus arseniciresistens]
MLALCVLAAWGAGQLLWARLRAPQGPGADPAAADPWLGLAMAAALGLGLYICAFQLLAIAGALRPPAVLGLLAAGLLAAALQARAAWGRLRALPAAPGTRAQRIATWVALGALLVSLSEPLSPPHAFDEMMYHLPWARETATSGALGIHDWLRYPWFPYNYNLLYAAALPLAGDVFPHLLHALAGWLSAAIVFRLALAHSDRITACMAAVILLAVGEMSNALIDMGVALFVLAACTALWIWHRAPGNSRPLGWLMLAGFLMGLAIGSKYQALTFMPLLGLFVLWRERRVGRLAAALAVLLLPCIYWYARNWLQTGDPFNPIGARVFGFSNWNETDYVNQVNDVSAHASLPNIMLWPLLLVPFGLFWRNPATRPAVRAATVFGAWSLVVWVLTSRYPRYMTASFPLLAWLGAMGWRQLGLWAAQAVQRRAPVLARGAMPRVATVALLAVLALAGAQRFAQHARMVSPTPESREAFLRTHVPGYEALQYANAHRHGKLYIVALSDAIYFAHQPAWGDVFGPWRYADFVMQKPAEMGRRLAAAGFGTIAIHTRTVPILDGQAGFGDHFDLLYDKEGTRIYRVKAFAPSPASS